MGILHSMSLALITSKERIEQVDSVKVDGIKDNVSNISNNSNYNQLNNE